MSLLSPILPLRDEKRTSPKAAPHARHPLPPPFSASPSRASVRRLGSHPSPFPDLRCFFFPPNFLRFVQRLFILIVVVGVLPGFLEPTFPLYSPPPIYFLSKKSTLASLVDARSTPKHHPSERDLRASRRCPFREGPCFCLLAPFLFSPPGTNEARPPFRGTGNERVSFFCPLSMQKSGTRLPVLVSFLQLSPLRARAE